MIIIFFLSLFFRFVYTSPCRLIRPLLVSLHFHLDHLKKRKKVLLAIPSPCNFGNDSLTLTMKKNVAAAGGKGWIVVVVVGFIPLAQGRGQKLPPTPRGEKQLLSFVPTVPGILITIDIQSRWTVNAERKCLSRNFVTFYQKEKEKNCNKINMKGIFIYII